MTYPATLDVYTTVNNGDTITAGMFNDPNDGIEKLMIEVGIDGTTAESLKYKCDNFFVAATHIFFAQATPPTGWTIDTAHKDNVLACKADSGDYSVVGANKGSWTTAHNHQWYDYVDDASRSYNSAGSVDAIATVSDRGGIRAVAQGAGNVDVLDSDMYTANQYVGEDSGWRPYATVGVIATYTGA
jgi:hypothetical protein